MPLGSASKKPPDEVHKPPLYDPSVAELFYLPLLRLVSSLLCHTGIMSSELDDLIQLGHDITTYKYYGLATGIILFYDYFLTLADEIKYMWCGRKSWTFWLFITTRYFPMTYQFWQLAVSYTPVLDVKVCDKTAWYAVFMFFVCTLLAQTVITLRIYAVTGKNIRVAIGFATISAAQFGIGVCLMSLTGREGGMTPPPIPFDAYRLCLFARHRHLETATITISLFYDALAFSAIVFFTMTSDAQGRIPTILRTVAEDAMLYFLFIFTAHFVLEMTLNLARESLQVLPGIGIVVYLPVMASRIMLSLRKAADVRHGESVLPGPSTAGSNFRNMRFFRPPKGLEAGRDDILLETISESQISTR